jgi:hypothetical protein
MPRKNDHVAQAHHNHAYWSAQDLVATSYRDWIVTGIFYEAVHWVEAFLATKAEHPTSHGQRDACMVRYSDLDPIVGDYGVLKSESQNARYNCYAHTADEVRDDLIPLIGRIGAHIQSLV